MQLESLLLFQPPREMTIRPSSPRAPLNCAPVLLQRTTLITLRRYAVAVLAISSHLYIDTMNRWRRSFQMRAGTQTLIQALQAIPWAEDQDNDDEILSHDVTPTETDSDEDDRTGES